MNYGKSGSSIFMTASFLVAPFLRSKTRGQTNHTAKVIGAPEAGAVGDFLDRQQRCLQQFESAPQPALLKIYDRRLSRYPQNRPADR